MKLLFDSDAFCKLAIGGVLDDTISLFGVDLSECGRLPALPHMLRRGRLRTVYGPEACDALVPISEAVPVLIQAQESWLDRLTQVVAVDPGEAQIFAVAAELSLLVVSGDKRALRVLKDVVGYPQALKGRIAVLEAVLVALCDRLGSNEVRNRLQPMLASDVMISVCFSEGNIDPCEGLWSYYNQLASDLSPLELWHPHLGGLE